MPSGAYTVVFGRQPVADLLNNLVDPRVHGELVLRRPARRSSGKLGRPVASPLLSLYDDGAQARLHGLARASRAKDCPPGAPI